MSNLSMPNKQRRHINMGTPKKNRVKPTWLCGVTKYAEQNR
jgi:hypothetical protein